MNTAEIPGVGALPVLLAYHINLLCDRHEAAWLAGRRPRIEDIMTLEAEPGRTVLLRELLAVEVAARGHRGEAPDPREYRHRFPDDAALIEAVIAEAAPTRDGPATPDREPPAAAGMGPRDAADRETRADNGPPGGPPEDRAGANEADPTPAHDDPTRSGDGTAAAGIRGPIDPIRPTIGPGRRFRILRRHARGGLGEVFVAFDDELRREVALKEIRPEHAGQARSRARFLLEAEITGGLEHPGVVPVYGLGRYPDGRPYYAMRFVHGRTLKEAIADFHGAERPDSDPGERALALRQLLRRYVDACNAMAYAHSRGVLHRDIKPANILLGPFGETLIVDWGLAKPMEGPDEAGGASDSALRPSLAGDATLTQTGSALGSPGFISPEQAAGWANRVGPPSDVYGLGATLYCVLTGRASIEERNIDQALRKAQAGDFPSPRQVRPEVDAGLEAICLKAMAREPEDRYSSALALAEDLEHWLADESVAAWREPWSRRARRWAKRHRTVVTTAAGVLLAGVLGLVAVLAVQASANAKLFASLDRETRANAELNAALGRETRANASLNVANAELTRSRAAVQARYDLAVEATRAFHTGVSEDFLLKEEKFKELRERLLNSAADFYGRLSALLGRETDQASRRALAQSNFELAALTDKVGRSEDALAANRAVLAAREALAAEPGADAGLKADVGRSLLAVGMLLEGMGKTGEALAAYRRSEGLMEGPAGSDPAVRAAVANCRSRLGHLLFRTGQTADSLAAYRLARSDQEALAAAPGATDDARRNLASTLNTFGYLLVLTGRPGEAEAEFRKALALEQGLVNANPAATAPRSRLATVHNSLGWMLSDTGRPEAAAVELRAALALLQGLADANPAVTEFRSRRATVHSNLGRVLTMTGRLEAAEAEYREALALQQNLVEANPGVTAFRSLSATVHGNLGIVLRDTGRPKEAETEFRAALALLQALADANPRVIEFRSLLALNHANLGGLLWNTGRPNETVDEFRQMVALFQGVVEANPAATVFRVHLANAHSDLADVLRFVGRAAEARDSYDQSIAIHERRLQEAPKDPGPVHALAGSYRRRGLNRRDLGDFAGAAADARRALALWDGVPSRTGAEWFETACCHAALAGLAGSAGSGTSADSGPAEAERAMELLRRAVAMGHRQLHDDGAEAALGPLRDRDDFRALVMDQDFPDDPFAPK
jgi:eukaryotic-like serine/threonine-protein kinase